MMECEIMDWWNDGMMDLWNYGIFVSWNYEIMELCISFEWWNGWWNYGICEYLLIYGIMELLHYGLLIDEMLE